MSDLIYRPEESGTPVAISKTDFQPVKSSDQAGVFRQFVNFVRLHIGLKPLELAIRFAEADVRKREAQTETIEVENQIKLLKAKQDYELIQSEIRRRDLEAEGKAELAKAEADKVRGRNRSSKAIARIQEAAAREIERRNQSPEEAILRLKTIVDKIRAAGGDVEISPLDGDACGSN